MKSVSLTGFLSVSSISFLILYLQFFLRRGYRIFFTFLILGAVLFGSVVENSSWAGGVITRRLEKTMHQDFSEWVSFLYPQEKKIYWSIQNEVYLHPGRNFRKLQFRVWGHYIPLGRHDIYVGKDKVYSAEVPSDFVRLIENEDTLFAYIGVVAQGMDIFNTPIQELENEKFVKKMAVALAHFERNPFAYEKLLTIAKRFREPSAPLNPADLEPVRKWIGEVIQMREGEQYFFQSLPASVGFRNYLEIKIQSILEKFYEESNLHPSAVVVSVDRETIYSSKLIKGIDFIEEREREIVPVFNNNGLDTVSFSLSLPTNIDQAFESEDQLAALVIYTALWRQAWEHKLSVQASIEPSVQPSVQPSVESNVEPNIEPRVQPSNPPGNVSQKDQVVFGPDEIMDLDRAVVDMMIRLATQYPDQLAYNPNHYFKLLERIDQSQNEKRRIRKRSGKYRLSGIIQEIQKELNDSKINYSTRITALQAYLLKHEPAHSKLFSGSHPLPALSELRKQTQKLTQTPKVSANSSKKDQKEDDDDNDSSVLSHSSVRSGAAQTNMSFEEVLNFIQQNSQDPRLSPHLSKTVFSMIQGIPANEWTIPKVLQFLESDSLKPILSAPAFPNKLFFKFIKLIPPQAFTLEALETLANDLLKNEAEIKIPRKGFLQLLILKAMRHYQDPRDLNRLHQLILLLKAHITYSPQSADHMKMLRAVISERQTLPSQFIASKEISCSDAEEIIISLIKSGHSHSEITQWILQYDGCMSFVGKSGRKLILEMLEKKPVSQFDELIQFIKEIEIKSGRTLRYPSEFYIADILKKSSTQIPKNQYNIENITRFQKEVLSLTPDRRIGRGMNFPFYQALVSMRDPQDLVALHRLWIEAIPEFSDLNHPPLKDLKQAINESDFIENYLRAVKATLEQEEEDAEDILLKFPAFYNDYSSSSRKIFEALLDSDHATNDFIQKWINRHIEVGYQAYFYKTLREKRPVRSFPEIALRLNKVHGPNLLWSETKKLFKTVPPEEFTLEKVSQFISSLTEEENEANRIKIVTLAVMAQLLRHASAEDEDLLVHIYNTIDSNRGNVEVNLTFCNALKKNYVKLIRPVLNRNIQNLFNYFTPTSFTLAYRRIPCGRDEGVWVKNIYNLMKEQGIDEEVIIQWIDKKNRKDLLEDFLKSVKIEQQSLSSVEEFLHTVPQGNFKKVIMRKAIFGLPKGAFTWPEVSEFVNKMGQYSYASILAMIRLLEVNDEPEILSRIHSFLADYSIRGESKLREYSESRKFYVYAKKPCKILDSHFERLIDRAYRFDPSSQFLSGFTPVSFECVQDKDMDEFKRRYESIKLKAASKYHLVGEEDYILKALLGRNTKDLPETLQGLKRVMQRSVQAHPENILKFPILTEYKYSAAFFSFVNDWYSDDFIQDHLIRNWGESPEYLLAWIRYLPPEKDKKRLAIQSFIDQRRIRSLSEWSHLLSRVRDISAESIEKNPATAWMSLKIPKRNVGVTLFLEKELEHLFKSLPPEEVTGDKIFQFTEENKFMLDARYALNWAVMQRSSPQAILKIHRELMKLQPKLGDLQSSVVHMPKFCKTDEYKKAYIDMIKTVMDHSPIDMVHPDKVVRFYDLPLKEGVCFIKDRTVKVGDQVLFGKTNNVKNAVFDELGTHVIANSQHWPNGLAWAWIQAYLPGPIQRDKPKKKDPKVNKIGATIEVAAKRGILSFQSIPLEIQAAQNYLKDFSLDAATQQAILEKLPKESFTFENLSGYAGIDDVWAKQGLGSSLLEEEKLGDKKTFFEQQIEQRKDKPELLQTYLESKKLLDHNPILVYDLENSEKMQRLFVTKMQEARTWPEDDLEKQHQVFLSLAKRGPSEWTDDHLYELSMRPNFDCANCLLEMAKQRAFWDLDRRIEIYNKYLKLKKLSFEFVKNQVKSDPDAMDFYVHDIITVANFFFPENSIQRSDILEKLANDVMADERLTKMIESEKIRGQQEHAVIGLYLINNFLNQYRSPKERMALVRFFTKNKELPEPMAKKIRQQVGVNRLRRQFLQLPPYAKAMTLNALIMENLLPDPKYRKKLEKLIWESVDEENRDIAQLFYGAFAKALATISPSQEGPFVSFLLGQLANVQYAHPGQKLKYLLESLGGTGISMGQKIYQRRMVGPEYLEYLRDMTDHSPLPSRKVIYDRLRGLLGVDRVDDVMSFREILGGASTALVIRTVLKDGQDRALKMTFEYLKNRTELEHKKMELALHYLIEKGGPKYNRLWPVIEEVYEGLKGQDDLRQEQFKTDILKKLYEGQGVGAQFKVIQSFPSIGIDEKGTRLFNSGSEEHVFMEVAQGKTLTRLEPEQKKVVFPAIFRKEMDILLANPDVNGMIFFEKDRHMGNFTADFESMTSSSITPVIYVFDYPLLSSIRFEERNSLFKLIGWLKGREIYHSNPIKRAYIDQKLSELLVKEIATGPVPEAEIRNQISTALSKSIDPHSDNLVESIFALFSIVDEVGAKSNVTVKKTLVPYMMALGHAERYSQFAEATQPGQNAFVERLTPVISELMKVELGDISHLKSEASLQRRIEAPSEARTTMDAPSVKPLLQEKARP